MNWHLENYIADIRKKCSLFYRMLNCDKDKARDFLQDIFLKIIEKPQSYDPARKFSPWFYSLAANMCKNEYKKIKIRNENTNSIVSSDISVETNIYNELDLKSFIGELYHFLEDLNDDHKSVFLLRYGNNLSIKEIAEILECPEGTVKSRLYYTMKYLSERLTVYNPGGN